MKRELKFRAWDTSSEPASMLGPYDITDSIFNNKDVRSLNLMQFTGLKDKNGKEVYDGDIIRYTLMEGLGMPERRGMTRIIKTDHLGSIGWYDTEVVVLGNRYENPELLTQFELS